MNIIKIELEGQDPDKNLHAEMDWEVKITINGRVCGEHKLDHSHLAHLPEKLAVELGKALRTVGKV